MNDPQYIVRRATVDDLEGMKALWEWAHFQVLDLERRLTEFQLVVSEEGDLIGAIGLHIDGKQGFLHSEACTRPEEGEVFRAALWERIQSLARYHGLIRLWTQEQAPFWLERAGFRDPSPGSAAKIPPLVGGARVPWRVVQLREEMAATISIERELELFQAAQKEEAERLVRLGNRLKVFIMILLILALGAGTFYMFKVVAKNNAVLRSRGR